MSKSPDQPRVSVVIPTCQRNDALAQCLDCLAPGVQTLAPAQYEVIVSDDGSKTTAEKMVREKYPWARWTAGPRRGPAANRNHGASRARGEWLAFTDDDCLPDPHWLAAFANALAPDAEVYEGTTEAPGPFRWPFVSAPSNLEGGSLWSCNMMVSQRIFEELSGFDEGFPHAADEDTDFHQRVTAAGLKPRFVPDARILHPLVRRPWGRKSAQMWESKVRLALKSDPTRRPFTRGEMVRSALATRARQLKRAPLHLDWILGVLGLLVELIWIARHTRRWDHKHRADLSRREKSRPAKSEL